VAAGGKGGGGGQAAGAAAAAGAASAAAAGGEAAAGGKGGRRSSKQAAAQQAAAAEQQAAAAAAAHGEHGGSGWANMFAAVMGALATALVESPVELFRHQAQAGVVGGNLLGEMAGAVRRGGPTALYWGFLPYLLESLPYDITELATYFQLRDGYEAAAAGQSPLRALLDRAPPHVWDLALGASAGAAAVLVSMPFDCIKTVIQTRGGEAALSPGVWGQTRAFVATGAQLVRRAGPGALFVGVVPRLVQQVPSSTICWWSIEACKAALAPWTEGAGAAPAGGKAAA
jgi:hypothetical protein